MQKVVPNATVVRVVEGLQVYSVLHDGVPYEVVQLPDVAAHVDELNAEIQRLKLLLNVEYGPMIPESNVATLRDGYVDALKERDTMREVLKLLAPDLKAMAILYAGQGDHQRSQALNNIAKSVGV